MAPRDYTDDITGIIMCQYELLDPPRVLDWQDRRARRMFQNRRYGERRLTPKGYFKFRTLIHDLLYRPYNSFIEDRPHHFEFLSANRKGECSMHYDKGSRLEFTLTKRHDGAEMAVIHSFGGHYAR